MRKFYLLYPNCQTSDKLTWSHICELLTIDDDMEREFYANETVSENWTVDDLHRQKESGLFMRLAISKDKQGVLALAREGQKYHTPEDVVKDTYTLEFLGIEDKSHFNESEVEQKLIDNLQKAMNELRKIQKVARFTTNEEMAKLLRSIISSRNRSAQRLRTTMRT